MRVTKPRMAKTILGGIIAVTISACAMGPTYVEPVLPLPSNWKYDQGWSAGATNTNITVDTPATEQQASWWVQFNDPQLSALMTQAHTDNQTLAQAQARYRAAQAQWQSTGADAWPQANASVNWSRSGGTQSNLDSTSRESASAVLGVSWVPDLWGKVSNARTAAAANVQASAAEQAAVALALQISIAQTYVTLRQLDRQQTLLQATLADYERSLTLTRNQYEAGIVARSDVIQAETQLQSLRSDTYSLAVSRAQAENALAVLVGQVPSGFVLARSDVFPKLPELAGTTPLEVIRRRPDVAAAERTLAAANARIGVAAAAWLPDLSLSLSGGLSADSWSQLLDDPVRVWSLGPTLAQTLFDGGSRRAARLAAEAAYDEQAALWRQTVLESIQEIEDALASLRLLTDKAEQQARLLTLAEENERVVTNRYRSGLVSFLEVASARATTLSARQESETLQADRLNAVIVLAAAMGGSWPTEAD